MNRIDVTCAIVVVGGKLLACQKGESSDHPFEWEFPGGKIETGETAEHCIVREINEELGVEIIVEKKLKFVDFDYSFKKIRLIPFICKIVKGMPNALEHRLICWQPIECFNELKWSDADKKLFYLNENEIEC